MVFASPKETKMSTHKKVRERVHRTLQQDESPLALQLGLSQNNTLSVLLTAQ